MTFGMTIRGTALILGLLAGAALGASSAFACEGTGCAAAGKPLDLKKFMREQAASTRTTEAMQQTRGKGKARHTAAAQHTAAHSRVAHAHRPHGRSAVAEAQPKDATTEAASAYASQAVAKSEPDVQVVPENEVNDIDRAAGPPPPETSGTATTDDAPPSAKNVPVVVANDFNEIDRKAADAAQSAVADMASAPTPVQASASTSWIQWLWSAIGAGFLALAAFARHLLT